MVYRSRLHSLIEEDAAEGEDALEMRRMRPRLYTESARQALRRQLSEAPRGTAATTAATLETHASPDELGEFMWEMRPRYATSAGELKRRRKHEQLEKRKELEVSSPSISERGES